MADSFFGPLKNIFSSSEPQTTNTEADKIILAVKEQIVEEHLVQEITKRYEEIKKIKTDKKEFSLIPIYISYEAFIIKNKPPIVKTEFTKISLREYIRNNFDTNQLNTSFRLLFKPPQEQIALLYEEGIKQIARYIAINLGSSHLTTVVNSISDEHIRSLITVNEQGLNFSKMQEAIQELPIEQINQLFQKLLSGLLSEIGKSLGENVSETIVGTVFDSIKRTYDYELITQFLDLLPPNLLQGERVRRISREELESKIQQRTTELDQAKKDVEQKLEIIKKQNDDLEAAKQALQKSLQEAQRLEMEIKAEKEKVEEKVKERTAELNTALENLQISNKQTEYEKARLFGSLYNLSLGFIMTDINDNIIASNQIVRTLLKSNQLFKNITELATYLKEATDIISYYHQSKIERVQQKIEEIHFNNVYVRMFFTPIIINQDECIGIAILIEDITEMKLLERSKDEFFAIASHDLRTPLTAIRGFTSLIMDHFSPIIDQDKNLVSMVQNIHDSSIRLIKLVNSFLDASQLEQGKVQLNPSSFTLEPMIEDVLNDLNQLATTKNIYLKFDKKEMMPNIYADPDKVKQVIFNLVGNAIKFTEKGGITVTTEKKDDKVKVLVTDTGLGISEKYLSMLFKKFQQAGERILTRDAATGSGMGLYISKLLLEAMGGSINIDHSKLGEGSTFSFSVPIAK